MNPKYNKYNNYQINNVNEGDRFFYAAPFLFGALAGGAVASTVRPRPVFVSGQSSYNPVPYQSPGAYGQASYSYYYPQFRNSNNKK